MVSRDNRVRNREVCEGEETRRNPYLVDYEEQRNSGMYRVRRTAGTGANSQKRHTVHEQTGRQIIAMKTREEVPRFRQNVDGGAKDKGFADSGSFQEKRENITYRASKFMEPETDSENAGRHRREDGQSAPEYSETSPRRRSAVVEYQEMSGRRRGTTLDYQEMPIRRRSTTPDYQEMPVRRRSTTPDYQEIPVRRRGTTSDYQEMPIRRRSTSPDYQEMPVRRRSAVPDYQEMPPRRNSAARKRAAVSRRKKRIMMRRLTVSVWLLCILVLAVVLVIRNNRAAAAESGGVGSLGEGGGVIGAQQNPGGNGTTVQGLPAEVFEAHPEWTEDFLTPNEYSRPGDALETVNNIFVHYTANPGTSAAQNRSYFEQQKDMHEASVSAHFIIGYEGEIIQCVPLDEIAYAVMTRNFDSISIECCYKAQDGSFTQETYDSLISLLAWLTDAYGLDSEDILRHYDCGGKKCPLYYTNNEDEWEQLKKDVDKL